MNLLIALLLEYGLLVLIEEQDGSILTCKRLHISSDLFHIEIVKRLPSVYLFVKSEVVEVLVYKESFELKAGVTLRFVVNLVEFEVVGYILNYLLDLLIVLVSPDQM